MEVPLQLILGILLVVTTCSLTESHKLRHIREAPPPSVPTPIQNVTEINNRDLNKIVKDNPKTEALDSKAKTVNNVNNFEEFPLKLGESDEEHHHQHNVDGAPKNDTEEENKASKEVDSKDDSSIKANKEKLGRQDNSRSIDVDASKFWSSDFHSKNNVFTLPPSTSNVPTNRPPENPFGATRHPPSFENTAELTTPTTKLFDHKFKETVESVEQTLDDVNLDNEDHHDSREEESNGDNLAVEDLLIRKPENSSIEFENTKTVVNNETIEKNSIHKDVEIEHVKKAKLETTFNETKAYDGETKNKGEISSIEKKHHKNIVSTTTVVTPIVTTRKSALLKEPVGEKSTTHLLSNNIETEFISPTKGITTTTTDSSAPWKLNDIKLTSSSSSTSTTETLLVTTTVRTTTIATNISDQENVIPLQLGTESALKKKYSESTTAVTNEFKDPENKQKPIIIRAIDLKTTTTDTIPSTTETTSDVTLLNNILSDATTSVLPEEGTTTFIVEAATEISDTTTESADITTTILLNLDDIGSRTSKSLDNPLVTEQMFKTSERFVESSTKAIEQSTESTIRNELDSTTLNDDKDSSIQKVREIDATTTEVIATSTVGEEATTFMPLFEATLNVSTTTQKSLETSHEAIQVNATVSITAQPAKSTTTTEFPSTTKEEKLPPTTTEFAFVHIESTASKHTTLLPEILTPNLNYSTSTVPDNEEHLLRNVVLRNNGTENISSSSSSSTTVGSTSEGLFNVTESGTEANHTENSFTADVEGEGGNTGKIAAIAISSVGAVCLVLLAGLLYVMKKRQKRLNYGPRCRPVSLDDYSIDNLSVYNSVRRKGGARTSKRSFGNPAFDDPVAPTHPLNFTALAKFSTNIDDIKAEFEEVPQITARTSELPEGCDTKNRYANVIPLPETRVFLNSIDGYPNSDYINANYVTGPKNIKGYYIATQGPMQNTVDDFWRMVWEQQTKVILMLTHLVENGLEKCVDYLPESEVLECSRLFGDFQITLKKREAKEKYIISSLQLKNMVSNSWREVTHFWYLGWPEKGVPSEANSLIAFLIEARSYMKTATMDKKDTINGIQNGGNHSDHNPVVIHCSPGTGRTGVAIACDIAIREFETSRLIDIPKIVYRIRRDRANAIQTKEQYIFIYKVVSLYATKLTGGALDNL